MRLHEHTRTILESLERKERARTVRTWVLDIVVYIVVFFVVGVALFSYQFTYGGS